MMNYAKNKKMFAEVDKLCSDLDLNHIAPLKYFDSNDYMEKVIDSGFKAVITGIDSYGLNEDFLGAIIDENIYDKLLDLQQRTNLDISGNNGEFKTLVVDGPFFKRKLNILDTEKDMESDFSGTLNIKDVELN